EIPVSSGVIDDVTLRDTVEAEVGAVIAQHRLEAWLGLDDARDPRMPSATVAVCTRDRLDDLERCLRALAALPPQGQEILVVDSASRDGEAVQALVARHAGVRYVREVRPGLDIARNTALREARNEIVIFCDDDAEVDEGWLRALCRAFTDPRVLCATGLILPLELETPAQEWFERTNGFSRGYRRVLHDGVHDDAFFVSRIGAGASMALRRTVLDSIGPFDEALDAGTVTRSGGDHDYFTRILAAGYCIVYEPAALSWHRHRREWHELRTAVFGYGTGVWAYLTRQWLAGEPRAALVALGWMRWQLIGVVKGSLGLRTLLPVDLAVAEIRGCLAGPRAYLKARRLAAIAQSAS
ncbi:MAG TPA: glycosyltransferase, partial [Gemmatimonadaceae bacterium]|nr:glycosyltransferase [Gemmatimonadaceae bacterium]